MCVKQRSNSRSEGTDSAPHTDVRPGPGAHTTRTRATHSAPRGVALAGAAALGGTTAPLSHSGLALPRTAETPDRRTMGGGRACRQRPPHRTGHSGSGQRSATAPAVATGTRPDVLKKRRNKND
eukprot:1818965-Prymnesium_polylepis.1